MLNFKQGFHNLLKQDKLISQRMKTRNNIFTKGLKNYDRNMSDFSIHSDPLKKSAIGITVALAFSWALAADLPTFEEVAAIRAKADEHRFKIYVLDKLEVNSYVQEKNGLCLDFIGKSDGLYRSKFSGGPIMVDLSNCGEEDHFIDGRIKALKLLEAREHRDGLTKDQIDHALEEINEIFADKFYDPEFRD